MTKKLRINLTRKMISSKKKIKNSTFYMISNIIENVSKLVDQIARATGEEAK